MLRHSFQVLQKGGYLRLHSAPQQWSCLFFSSLEMETAVIFFWWQFRYICISRAVSSVSHPLQSIGISNVQQSNTGISILLCGFVAETDTKEMLQSTTALAVILLFLSTVYLMSRFSYLCFALPGCHLPDHLLHHRFELGIGHRNAFG